MSFKEELNKMEKGIKEHIDTKLEVFTIKQEQADNERTTLFQLYKEQGDNLHVMDKQITKNKSMLGVVASITSLIAGSFFAWLFGIFGAKP